MDSTFVLSLTLLMERGTPLLGNDITGNVLSPKIDSISNPTARVHSLVLSMSDLKYTGLTVSSQHNGRHSFNRSECESPKR